MNEGSPIYPAVLADEVPVDGTEIHGIYLTPLTVSPKKLGISPPEALHVGDSLRYDVRGAQAAGCQALHWGVEVTSFAEVQQRVHEG